MYARFLMIAASCALLATPMSHAADLGVPPPAVETGDAAMATHDFLQKDAVLLMIRATFSTISRDEIRTTLADDLDRLGAEGPSPADLAKLDRDLTLEGGYYLVSLKYLVASGGAAWPTDKSESTYQNDATVMLDALETHLLNTIEVGADPLPTLRDAQKILALSEGHKDVPPALDFFSSRDEIVAEIEAEHAEGTHT